PDPHRRGTHGRTYRRARDTRRTCGHQPVQQDAHECLVDRSHYRSCPVPSKGTSLSSKPGISNVAYSSVRGPAFTTCPSASSTRQPWSGSHGGSGGFSSFSRFI